MAVNTSPSPERQDGAILVVGDQGDIILQEAGTGKQVYRRGATEAQADIDVGSSASPIDLNQGDFTSGAKNAGGAEALAGKLISDDSADFSIKINWLNNQDATVISSTPLALQNTNDIEFNLIMRSDRFSVVINDESGGQNRVHGTINAH